MRYSPLSHGRRTVLLGLLLTSLATLATGCAGAPARPQPLTTADGEEIEPTVVAYRDYRDPLIRLNRAIFAFNDAAYDHVLVPLGNGWMRVTSEPVRASVGNFFDNLMAPIRLVNHALQLKPRAAARDAARFGINTTVGVLGLFDPAADRFEIEEAPTTFEDTLAQYGAGYGIYVVIPLLGPSDLRNGSSAILEGFFHPVSYLTEGGERIVVQGFDYFQDFAPQAERYHELEAEARDPYVFFRNLYLQGVQRDAAHQRPADGQETK